MNRIHKFVTVTVLLSVVSGCSFFNSWDDLTYRFRHDETFTDVGSVLDWVSETIEYDYAPYILWETPKEVYDRKKGKCRDYSTLAVYFCWADLGISDVYLIALKNRSDSAIYHAIIKVNGVYYEPQVNHEQSPFDFSDWEIMDELSAEELLWQVVNMHAVFYHDAGTHCLVEFTPDLRIR